jgi:hypothetical protein
VRGGRDDPVDRLYSFYLKTPGLLISFES